ncbi:MAG: K(+)-transporting ATPase subunit C [Cellulosilyticaceae bacterium]
MRELLRELKIALKVTVVMLVICGIVYPLGLTGISKLIFPHQANGSLIEVDGKVIGSEIVGQKLDGAIYMKGRPSAVSYNTYTREEKENGAYKGIASGSSNYSATNPELLKRIEKDMEVFLKDNPTIEKEAIPLDLLTASGSGLDPHISVQAAEIQIPAISKATGLSEAQLQAMVASQTSKKYLGVFGEDTVNVLKVNLMIAKELGKI